MKALLIIFSILLSVHITVWSIVHAEFLMLHADIVGWFFKLAILFVIIIIVFNKVLNINIKRK